MNFYIKQDDFYHPKYWPPYIQAMALKTHKNNRERFRLFQFFTYNGLDPVTAWDLVQIKDYYRGAPVREDYDNSAWSQYVHMNKQLRDGSLFPNGSGIYSIIAGRVLRDHAWE